LNRTIWTNNKAFKSGISDTDNCPYCGQLETMEHMYYSCDNYSELQWYEISDRISELISNLRGKPTRMLTTYRTIIYNEEIENLKKYVPNTTIRKFIQILVHEIRRDIYYRKVNHPPAQVGEVNEIRRRAHLISTIKKTKDYLEYLGTKKWTEGIAAANSLMQLLVDQI